MSRIAKLDPTQGHEILEVGDPPGSPATTSAVLDKPPGAASEAELIERVLEGEGEAFRELVRPYEHAVFMATQGILNNEADAEDAAQEAVLKAFTNLAKFRGDSKFSTWLIRIATNEALMKLRRSGATDFTIRWTNSAMTRKATMFPGTSLTGARFPPRRCRQRSCGKHYPEHWLH